MFEQRVLTAESPSLVEQTPGENRGVIEIALDAFAHHFFKPLPGDPGVPPFAKIGKVRHQKDAQTVRPVQKDRIVHFYMNPQKIESEALRCRNIVFERLL